MRNSNGDSSATNWLERVYLLFLLLLSSIAVYWFISIQELRDRRIAALASLDSKTLEDFEQQNPDATVRWLTKERAWITFNWPTTRVFAEVGTADGLQSVKIVLGSDKYEVDEALEFANRLTFWDHAFSSAVLCSPLLIAFAILLLGIRSAFTHAFIVLGWLALIGAIGLKMGAF